MSAFGKGTLGRDKFYKGSKEDSAWNHDLLWKARVTSENGLIGIQSHENIPSHYTTTVGPAGTIDATRVRNRATQQQKLFAKFTCWCDNIFYLWYYDAAIDNSRPGENR